MKYPYIKFDLSPTILPHSNRKSIEKNDSSNTPVNERKNEKITKFDKLLIDSIIRKYEIIIIENNAVIDNEEKKMQFLVKNKEFLFEIKQEIFKSKEFMGMNSIFLNANENDRNFHFQKLVFCIQKQIKNFILNYCKRNFKTFAFLKINKHKHIYEELNSSFHSHKSHEINENKDFIKDLMKNVYLTLQEIPLAKKILSKISADYLKKQLEVINSIDVFIEEKLSFLKFY